MTCPVGERVCCSGQLNAGCLPDVEAGWGRVVGRAYHQYVVAGM